MIIEYFHNQEIALEKVLSRKYNFVMLGGAVRGGKTIFALTSLVLLCEIYPRSRWCIIRESMEKIRTTTIPSFEKLECRGKLLRSPFEYTHPNGSKILFKSENFDSDKELNWMRGLEVNGFAFEEINECQEQTLEMAFTRAGSWIINDSEKQPFPVVLATCNPTNGWVKDKIYTPFKNGTLKENWHYQQSRIYDNIPLLTAQPDYLPSLKANLNRYEYEVFVEGNWDVQLKTGGEWLKSFELDKHVKKVKYDPNTPIHISLDNNVYPYVTVTLWQLIKDGDTWIIRQIHEILSKDPENTPHRAGQAVASYLNSINYNQKIFIYGDKSTKSRNNIDDDKRSAAVIFMQSITKKGFSIEDRFLSFAPSVSNIGDFLNNILDGNLSFAKVEISEDCRQSINDYIETKQDKDGAILKKRITNPKTNVSYEPNGHITDTFKDFVVSAFNAEFKKFLDRFTYKPKSVTLVNRSEKYTL